MTRSIRRRLVLAMVLVVALVALFSVRLFDLQVSQAKALSAQAALKQDASVTIFASRGSIVDANGVVLADSAQRWDIDGSPKAAADMKPGQLADALTRLSDVLGVDEKTLAADLSADPTSQYAVLAKSVSLDVYNSVVKLAIPGIYADAVASRNYPDGAVAGNIVGFMGTDKPGAGVELDNNACLAPANGTTTYTKTALGVPVPGSMTVTKPAENGGTLQLTIDSDLQWYIQQVIAQQAEIYGAQWAEAGVVRVSDGAIMAAADYPSVDPNDVSGVSADDRYAKFFTRSFEPGSVMKPATMSSLLDAGTVTPTEHVTVPSIYTTGLPKGSFIKDSIPHGVEHWTPAGIIENSSNIGISVLSQSLSVQKRHDYLIKFGFGSKTAVDFNGESSGSVMPTKHIDAISDKAQQFGQAIGVTEAQMLGMYQTIGNDGVKMPLHIVAGCTHADGTVTDTPSTTGTRVVSATAANETMAMMETVVTQSALKNVLTIPGYRIAAKTGTAQVSDGHGYGSDRIVSVAGITSVDDPQYAVMVTLGLPTKVKTSAAAAPGFTTIMKQVIKTFHVQPSTTPAPNEPTTW